MYFKYSNETPSFLKDKPLVLTEKKGIRYATIDPAKNPESIKGFDPDGEWMPTDIEGVFCQTSSDKLDPISLLKENKLGGKSMVLADGNKWIIPQLRTVNGACFPVRPILTVNGVVYRVKDEYLRVSSRGDDIWEWIMNGELPTDMEVFDVLTDMFSVNYWVTKYHLLAHGVISSDVLWEILKWSVDFQNFYDVITSKDEELQKKNS